MKYINSKKQVISFYWSNLEKGVFFPEVETIFSAQQE